MSAQDPNSRNSEWESESPAEPPQLRATSPVRTGTPSIHREGVAPAEPLQLRATSPVRTGTPSIHREGVAPADLPQLRATSPVCEGTPSIHRESEAPAEPLQLQATSPVPTGTPSIHREGEAPAEPLQLQATSPVPTGTLYIHREGEAPAEPPQLRATSPVRTGTPSIHREGEAPAEPPPSLAQAYPARRHPAKGVLTSPHDPTIVYLTVCTKDRKTWLATPEVHAHLNNVWQRAEAWRVGRYVIMPDHLHLFAAWIDSTIELDNWVRYWKSQFTKTFKGDAGSWQTGHWDTRLRGVKSYESKWEYVRDNPVRHKLVTRAEDWPYQGEMYCLNWNE